MNAAFADSLDAVADRLEAEKDTIRGVIVTSAKKTFFAGGDLARPDPRHPRRRRAGLRRRHAHQAPAAPHGDPRQARRRRHQRRGPRRRLTRSRWPATTAIALDTPGTKIGLPEVTLGLLPGGGGVVRTVRLLGIADALLKVLLQGTQYAPRRALAAGLVHEVAADRDEMLGGPAPSSTPTPSRASPGTRPGYKIPGGTPKTRGFAANLPAFPANLRKQPAAPPTRRRATSWPPPSRAPRSTSTPPRSSRRATSPSWPAARSSKNMIQAFFFDMQAVNSGASRPQGVTRPPGRQGRRARRRHDGRGHRLLLRPGRHRRRPQGRHPGGGRTRQGVLREAAGQGARQGPHDPGEARTRCSPGSPPPRNPPTWPAATP